VVFDERQGRWRHLATGCTVSLWLTHLDENQRQKKKSFIKYTDVSSYPHVGNDMESQLLRLLGPERILSGSSECWVFSNGFDSFSVKSLELKEMS
jgi:hypothetical protein